MKTMIFLRCKIVQLIIAEKAFSVYNMEQPLEAILIPQQRPSIAITQTRKHLGLCALKC